VAAVEIGLVCPNTTATERLEELRIFNSLIGELAQRKSKPVFIKLPPHHDDIQQRHVLAMVDACLESGIEGLSLSGTRSVVEPRLAMGKGSLAGRPVFPDTLRIVAEVADRAGGRIAVKAAGGVFSGRDALEMLQAGADVVEVYSAFIYRGWNVARQISTELAELGTIPRRSPDRFRRDWNAAQNGAKRS
jgi:dihydroorotate dehydrogenase (fumarate)/dihydroorotate dehydrogenase